MYLLSHGKTPQEVAEVLMLDIDTIGNYRKCYKTECVPGLLKNNYFGSKPILSCAEIAEFSAYLES